VNILLTSFHLAFIYLLSIDSIFLIFHFLFSLNNKIKKEFWLNTVKIVELGKVEEMLMTRKGIGYFHLIYPRSNFFLSKSFFNNNFLRISWSSDGWKLSTESPMTDSSTGMAAT